MADSGKVVFLGVEGSGKTVLNAALARAFKEHESDGWFLKPKSRDSFRFLEQLPSHLDMSDLPGSTLICRTLEWSVLQGRNLVREFSVLDYPGEIYRYAFLDAKDERDPAQFEEKRSTRINDIHSLLQHLLEADTVFVLFNLDDANDLSTNGRNLDAVWITDACLDYLEKLPSPPRIVFLLTQIDRYVDLFDKVTDIRETLRKRVPLIWHNHPDLDVAAVSLVAEASGPYGLNHLMGKWLETTPVVGAVCEKFTEAASGLSRALEKFAQEPWNGSSDVLTALEDYERVRDTLPWFVDVSNLVGKELSVEQDECVDLKCVAAVISRLLDRNTEGEELALRSLMRELEDESLKIVGRAGVMKDSICSWMAKRLENIAVAKRNKIAIEEKRRKRRKAVRRMWLCLFVAVVLGGAIYLWVVRFGGQTCVNRIFGSLTRLSTFG